jgi:hypothetical protein
MQSRLKRHKGRPYEPKNTGSPSWAEEQLVLLNLWRIQYFYDLKAACFNGHLGWGITQQDALQLTTIPVFFSLFVRRRYRIEQLMTVLAYVNRVQSLDQETTANQIRLPRPTAPSNRFYWACSPEPSATDSQSAGHGPLQIEFRPDSWVFAEIMSRDLKYSPLYGFPLSRFRKFGLALWGNQRMADLGLIAPQKEMPSVEYYFRWWSILSEEERCRTNAEF